MGLSTPKNPPMLSDVVASPVSTGLTINNLTPGTQVNQIHGTAPNNSIGAGIPKQVSNVQVSIANAQKGATCTIAVLFQRDPSDKSFSGVNIWVKGYQGNAQLVQVASGSSSPAKFVLNNTGETVSFTIQAFGNGGNAPINGAPTSSGTLPKSTTGGYGTGTTNYYNVNNPPPGGGASFDTAGKGFFLGGQAFGDAGKFAGGVLTNEVVYCVQLILQSEWTVRQVSAFVITGGGSSLAFTAGIYTTDGLTKLIDAGVNAFDTSTASQHCYIKTLGSPVKLQPGVYLFAWMSNAVTSGTVLCHDFPDGSGNEWFFDLINGNSFSGFAGPVRYATAANAGTLGALPATLGALTNVAHTDTQNCPVVVFAP